MRSAVLLCLVLILVFGSLAARADGIREKRPNLVFGEIGGKAFFFNAGYERYLTNHLGLGVGAVGWGGSGGGIGLFPLYATFVPFGETHSLYMAWGITLVAGSNNWDEGWSESIGMTAVGYTFQSEGGFFVRPTVSALYGGDDFLMIPGVALGGCF
jgi:hypothetical protein